MRALQTEEVKEIEEVEEVEWWGAAMRGGP
jgi:hypothetical protein